MDRIENHLPSVTLETSERTSNTSGAYRTAIARLIVKIRLVCLLPALETQELAATVEAFAEVLEPCVPLERLNDCYLHASRHRTSTYPLAATEILQAWRVISADEIAKRRPCTLCDGSGFGLVYDPKTDTEIQKECPHCYGRISTALERAQ